MRNFFTLIVITLFSMCASAQVVPGATIVTNSTLLCTGRAVTYSAATSETGLSYTWAVVPSKGLSAFSDLNSPTVTLTFSGTAIYTVYLNVSSASGATNTVQKVVSPGRSAVAAFNARLNSTGYPVQLILSNYSSNSLKNTWTFSDNTTDSSLNVIKEYNSGGNYSVSLFTEGAKGCNDISVYNFTIDKISEITLPNIFTPNGDGKNDVFIPITRGISGLNAWVYNRYGVLVSTWDKPKGGWDGYSTSGEECAAGVYVVMVDAFGFDGAVYKLKGTVTLIR